MKAKQTNIIDPCASERYDSHDLQLRPSVPKVRLTNLDLVLSAHDRRRCEMQ